MFKLVKNGSLLYYTVEEFDRTGLVNHCFTTKDGGVSEGIYKSMNLRFHSDDTHENVMENFRIIANEMGTDIDSLVLSNQVHEAVIQNVTGKDRGNGILSENKWESADGLITNVCGVALTVFFADCVPVLFLDKKERVICAVHSGWRGTVGKITSRAIDKMVNEYNSKPENILTAIGPSIGVCHYEVSDDVAFSFAEAFSDEVLEKHGDKYHVNMQLANEMQMIQMGIPKENITQSGICTYCEHETLFSHRYTSGKRGNMAAVIKLK